MPDLITINDTQIERLTYKDEPVVTFEMIARVHGIPIKNVQKSFERHKARFVDHKHVYHIGTDEAKAFLLGVGTNPNGIRLFTQKGYLLLTKPMKDERSWQVQERMIDEYFAMLTGQQSVVPSLPPSRTIEQDLDVVDQSITLLERLQLLDGRDRLFYADQVRNISRRGILPPVATPLPQSTPVPPGASISDRLYVVAPQLNAKEHRRLAILCGKLCAAEYRLRYPGMPINSFMQYVDGATRPVNWFLPGDWDWIDTILQARAATLGQATP